MKRGLVLTTTLCLVLGFQNCQNAFTSHDEFASNEVTVNLPPTNSGSNANTAGKVTYVEIPNISDEPQVSSKPGETTPLRLVISVQSGAIQLQDDANTILQKRCLDSEGLQELKTILSGVSICSSPGKKDEGELCAMRYKPGYASLYVDENRVNLGEERDSCGGGRKDLCGAVAEVFQAYVANVKNHWAEMDCE